MSEKGLKPGKCGACGSSKTFILGQDKRIGKTCGNEDCALHLTAIEWPPEPRPTAPPAVLPDSVRRDALIGLLLRFVGVPNAGTTNDPYYREAAKEADKFLAAHPAPAEGLEVLRQSAKTLCTAINVFQHYIQEANPETYKLCTDRFFQSEELRDFRAALSPPEAPNA